MQRLLVVVAFIFLVPPALQGQHPEIHSKHFLYGYPTGTPTTNDLIIRDIFALSSNDDRKLADWVAYRLDHRTVDGPSIRRTWKADPWLGPSETLEPDDYSGAHDALGIDRGHQAPLASFRGTLLADQTNLLSNITPQRSALNQGPWRKLESAVRELARLDTVHVVTGPLYERQMQTLPNADEPHVVPSGYWKVVAIDGSDGLHVQAFLLDQATPRDADYCAHRVTVDEVEEQSQLDLFWALGDGAEDSVEATAGTSALAERLGC